MGLYAEHGKSDPPVLILTLPPNSSCKPGLVIPLCLALIFPDCKMGSKLFMPSRQWEDE